MVGEGDRDIQGTGAPQQARGQDVGMHFALAPSYAEVEVDEFHSLEAPQPPKLILVLIQELRGVVDLGGQIVERGLADRVVEPAQAGALWAPARQRRGLALP